MLSCREASRLVADGLDHKLPWTRRLSLWMHLAMCGACARFRRQLVGLDRLVRRRVRDNELIEPEAHLRPEVRDRIKAAARHADS